MTVEEIYELIEKFAEGAWRVQQAGFDAVELHGAHGYLIAQFMSPYVNRRNDRFGGSFINRMRFVLEIISRIRHKCGRDFPIGVRYSGEEWVEGARTLEESVKIAVPSGATRRCFRGYQRGNVRGAGVGDGPHLLPSGLEHVRGGGGQEARLRPRHYEPHAARPGLLREDSGARED